MAEMACRSGWQCTSVRIIRKRDPSRLGSSQGKIVKLRPDKSAASNFFVPVKIPVRSRRK